MWSHTEAFKKLHSFLLGAGHESNNVEKKPTRLLVVFFLRTLFEIFPFFVADRWWGQVVCSSPRSSLAKDKPTA